MPRSLSSASLSKYLIGGIYYDFLQYVKADNELAFEIRVKDEMMIYCQNWLVSWNEQDFRLHDFMEVHDTIDWNNIANNQFSVGDVVYLYCSSPEQTIRYQMVVTRTEVPKEEEIDDEDFSERDTSGI